MIPLPTKQDLTAPANPAQQFQVYCSELKQQQNIYNNNNIYINVVVNYQSIKGIDKELLFKVSQGMIIESVSIIS